MTLDAPLKWSAGAAAASGCFQSHSGKLISTAAAGECDLALTSANPSLHRLIGFHSLLATIDGMPLQTLSAEEALMLPSSVSVLT